MTTIYERQLAGAVLRSIEQTTPRLHWNPRVSVGKWLAGVLVVGLVVALLLAVLVVVSSKRAAADEVYPLDVKAVRQ